MVSLNHRAKTNLVIFLILFTISQVESKYNEPCSTDPDCATNPDNFLVCGSSSTCLCQGEETSESIFDEFTQTCFRLADQSCDPVEMKCIPTSNCYNSKSGGASSPSCICHGNLTATSSGECRLNYGDTCSRGNDLCDINQFLSCDLNSLCFCPNGAFYNEGDKTCYLLPETTCSTAINVITCVSGTLCQLDSAENRMKCRCPGESNPVSEEPTKCYVSYGGLCDTAANRLCNPHANLECTAGRCSCLDENKSSVFDEKTGSCHVLAGKDCDPSPTGMKCIGTASCQSSQAGFTCVCNGKMTMDANGFCHLGFGDKCNVINDMCDPNRFLTCDQENHCSCLEGTFYDSHKCVLYPESLCSTPANPAAPGCANPTQCVTDPLDGLERCRCPGQSHPVSQDRNKCYVSHGQNCDNTNVICNPYGSLACHKGQCICKEENVTSVFEPKTDSCLLLAGQECTPMATKDTMEMQCIPTATCINTQGVSKCTCHDPLSPNSDGFCHLNYNQDCSRPNDLCYPNKYLSCNLEGKCSCASGATYNSTSKTCHLLPGAECSATQSDLISCGSGTECLQDSENPAISKCICPGSSSQSVIDPTICALGYNDPCNKGTDICDPYAFLECHDMGHCVCKDSAKTYYDFDTDTCYLKADESCSTANLSQKCTPNSKCLSKAGVQKCACDAPFIKNRDGQCFLPINNQCQLDNDLCDPSSFLSCNLENQCSCAKDAIYDSKINMCNLLVNASCAPHSLQDVSQPCVDYADCSESTKLCECTGKYEPNSDRLCYLEHGSLCDPQRDICNPGKNLECSPQSLQCICKDNANSWYNNFAKSCFLLQGASCKNTTSGCIPNAHCDEIDATCTCNSGLTSNQERFCYLQYDFDCSISNDLCNHEAFLECNKYTKKCACAREYETYYDLRSQTCHLIHDRPCSPEEGSQPCDPNAACSAFGTGNSTFRCQCMDDMRPNQERLCFLLRGQSCLRDSQTPPSPYWGCDPYGHLVCRDDLPSPTCDCQNEKMYFDANTQQCTTFPNEPCSNAIGAQECTPNALCDSGRCQCQNDYEDTVDGHCLKKYGAECQSSGIDDCNFKVNLECQDGLCLCRKGYLEMETHVNGDRWDWNCCGETRSQDFRVSCLPGFNHTCSNQTVLPDPYENSRCNENALLHCNDNVCTCVYPGEQLFWGSVRQCRSLAGYRCNDKDLLCGPHAECIFNSVKDQFGVCSCTVELSEVNTTLQYVNQNGICVNSSSRINLSLMLAFLSTLFFFGR